MRPLLPFSLALTAALGCAAVSEPPPDDTLALEEATPGAGAVVTGRAPRAMGGFPSVILLEPVGDAGPEAPREPPVMDQFGIAFTPRVLVARVGERVTFRNSEDVLHNVHVKRRDSGETEFNVATIPYGSYEHRFDAEGVYEVSCDTHPAMAAFLVLTTSPHATVAEPGGEFELSEVPPGAYRLRIWNLDPERSLEAEVTVEAPSTELGPLPPR